MVESELEMLDQQIKVLKSIRPYILVLGIIFILAGMIIPVVYWHETKELFDLLLPIVLLVGGILTVFPFLKNIRDLRKDKAGKFKLICTGSIKRKKTKLAEDTPLYFLVTSVGRFEVEREVYFSFAPGQKVKIHHAPLSRYVLDVKHLK